ncbi:MAG: NAD(P)/FAD-dependent oxidoreductase [Frankiales bacterium]|nr:NAD(P)/FAD-dependent oxidoreductase [Frankiales bacterium]
MSQDQAVVVGGGHNGLVAACYLAREGFDVEVVERDTVVGGAVSTVERWPGYRVDRGSSAHIMIRHTGIVEDLRLTECGLEYMDLDPWGFAPFVDTDITFHVDLDRTCTSIEKACGTRDADAYRAFVTDWSARNLKVFEAFQGAPTPMRLGRALWGVGKNTGLGGIELSRQFLSSADALLDEHFHDEQLKTALAWLGAQSGPPTHEPATADLVGWNTLMHLLPPGHPKGGSGMLSEALVARLQSYGGRVRLGDGAAALTRSGDRVTGVVTESGEHLRAATVVGACHVLRTLELLGDTALLERTRRSVRVGNGIGMAVRLATSDLPRYPTATQETYRALQLLAPSRQALRKAHGEWSAGLPPTEPAALAMTFSAFDDTLAPAGKHSVTVWGQWHPYALSNGESWDSIAEREGTKLVEAVDRVAPGFAGSVEHMHVQTPLDLERELGLRQGQVMHVEMTIDSMFLWRPTPELAGYRVPGVVGLYLCGASTHPGGGVFGASGRSAARAVLADRSPTVLSHVLKKVRRG